MEEEKFNKTPKKANRWFRAFVVLALLYGATFSLNAFFNWIFFFAAVYAFFMSYFLLPVQPKVFQGNPGNRSRESRQWQRPGQASPADAEIVTPQARARKIVVGISVSIFGLFFLLMLIGIFSADPEEEITTSDAGQDQQEEQYDDDANTSSSALVDKGNEFFNNQQYDSADYYYDKALELDGNYMAAVYGKGIVLYNRGNINEANAAFLRSYEGGYRFAWLSWALADMYDKQGNPSRAAEFYKESVGLDSSYVDSYKRLAELEPDNSAKYLELVQRHTK